ncbi:MAG: hypothetical protein NTY85_00475 [Actinobacteria bacterium]|nr:hypothetical protein [Actinomycetota bacterium]
MKKPLRICVVLIGLVSAFLTPLSAAELPDEQFDLFGSWERQHPGGANDKTFGVWFNDFGYQAVAQTSYLVSENSKGQLLCKSLEECKGEKDFSYIAFLPFCEDGYTTNCIANVFATDSKNKRISPTKRTYFPEIERNQFKGNPKFQLPSGSTASVLEFPGLQNSAGENTYSVGVYVIQRFSITNWDTGEFTSKDPSILANIAAVELESGNYKARVTKQIIDSYGRLSLDYMALGSNIECVVIENGICGKPVGFAENTSFALQLKLNAKTHGWMHGRLTNGKITVLKETSSGIEVEISGSPSRVPSVVAETTIENITDSIWGTVMGGTVPKNYGSKEFSPVLGIVASNRGTYMMSSFKAMQPFMTDKAVAMPSFWSVRSVERGQVVVAAGQKALDCLYKNGGDKGKILGFVNTNSTAYVSGPPTFNEKTQSLDYSVAAPHFAKDGSVFKGNYSIQLEANTARCMFGLQGTNLKATLSITNDRGESSIITSIAREDSGWFNFIASGFSFSTPTISLKLEEAPKESSKDDKTSEAKTASQPMKKMVCVKGKTKKTVTGSNPKCPAGFKKLT